MKNWSTFEWLMVWSIVATVCLAVCFCVANWPYQHMQMNVTMTPGTPPMVPKGKTAFDI